MRMTRIFFRGRGVRHSSTGVGRRSCPRKARKARKEGKAGKARNEDARFLDGGHSSNQRLGTSRSTRRSCAARGDPAKLREAIQRVRCAKRSGAALLREGGAACPKPLRGTPAAPDR